MMKQILQFLKIILLISLFLGCLREKPLYDGFPCKSDEDCNGLFCAKGICVTEACQQEGEARGCFSGGDGCARDGTNCEGLCKGGTQKCQSGMWGACVGQIIAKEEVCDGKDNDCNGKVDDLSFAQKTLCLPKPGKAYQGFLKCVKGRKVCEIEQEIVIGGDNSSFTLGSPKGDTDRKSNEGFSSATFNYLFSLGQTEVTQGQFREIMGYNPSKDPKKDQKPVNNVSWHEAAAYSVLLSKKNKLPSCFSCDPAPAKLSASERYEGTCITTPAASGEQELYVLACRGYRLPTEAEWFFAYYAQKLYSSFYNGTLQQNGSECQKDGALDQIAWYCSNSSQDIQLVKKKAPNRWLFHDMSGNVAEWVFDRYEEVFSGSMNNRTGPRKGSTHVVKGGSFKSPAEECRGAARAEKTPKTRSVEVGFRVARTIFKEEK